MSQIKFEKILGVVLILIGTYNCLRLETLNKFAVGVLLLLSGISILLKSSTSISLQNLSIKLYRLAALLAILLIIKVFLFG